MWLHLAPIYALCAIIGVICALGVLQSLPDRYTASGLVAVQTAPGVNVATAVASGHSALTSTALLNQVAEQAGVEASVLRGKISVVQSEGLALAVSATMRSPSQAASVVNALLSDYVIAHALGQPNLLGQQTVGATGLPAIRVLRQAMLPSEPNKPGHGIAGLLGAFGGVLVALVTQLSLAGARAARARGDADRAVRRAGMAVLSRLDARAGRSLADALLQSGTGPQMLAMRAARGRLGTAKVVSFVGGQAGPAASAAACAYARAAARDGQHVLLVDGDPEGAFMSRLLGEPHGRLSELLRGEAAWRDCVTHDRVAGLDTLVGMADGGGGHGLGLVIDQAVTVYDQVVLGAPKGTRLPRCDRAVTVLERGETVVLAAGE